MVFSLLVSVPGEDLVPMLVPLRGQRWVARARWLIEHCEPGTESPGESWMRLRIVEAGLPRPQVAIEIRDSDGRLVYRLASGYPEQRVGLEYDGGCWLGRVVVQRVQRAEAVPNSKIMFQLEFVGLSRLGSSPLRTLKDNIPRYQYLREQVTTSSRFGTYD